MKKKDVLKIVDSCFHEFASDFRDAAEKKANRLFDDLHLNSGEYDMCKMITDATEKGECEFRIGTDGTQLMIWPVSVDGISISFEIKDNKIIVNEKFNKINSII